MIDIVNRFTAHFPQTNDHGKIPDALSVRPAWIKVTDRGGSYRADLNVEGPEAALWTVLEWIGRPVHITDPHGMDIWRGKVTEIELKIAGMRVSLSYSAMYNRIKTIYSYQAPDGTPQAGITEWADDSLSQSEHGIRELIHSMPETYQLEAEDKRDRLLDEFKVPKGVPTMQQSGRGATITASGFFSFNEWKYYERLEGRFEHPYSPTVELNIGWQLAGSGFCGVFDRFHDIDARIVNLSKGQLLVRSNAGSIHNGTVTQVTSDPSGTQQETRTSFGIFTRFSDSIHIFSPGDWDGFRAEEVVNVSGLTSNSGYYSVEDVFPNRGINDHEQAELNLSGTFGTVTTDNDQSQVEVTVVQGVSVEINNGDYQNDDTFEDTETLNCLGHIVEQSFTSSFTGEAQMIALTVQKIGTPTDELRFQLCANDAGGSAAGTVLATLDVSPDDLPTVPQQQWFTFSSWVNFTQGTRYWIKISRTGSAHHLNLYRVGFTSDNLLSGETLRLGDSTTFHPAYGLSLSFMVYATEDTRDQIETIMSETDQFSGSIYFDFSTTNVRENPYRDGRSRASTLLNELLDKGGPNGRRLIALDDPDGNIYISEEPALGSDHQQPLMWADGRVTQHTGGPLPRGQLVVGEYVALAELPWQFAEVAGELSPVYIGEAELDIESGGHPTLRPRRVSTGDLIETA